MHLATELFVWGLLAHWIADWPLQNSWMAENKVSIMHPAAWIHGAIHFAVMAFVFPAGWAAVLAGLHVVIDTRIPLNWWRDTFRFTGEEPMRTHVAIWMDQVAHIVCIGGIALLVGWMVTGRFPLPVLQ